MPTYEIHVFMTQEEVKELSDDEYSLCFAMAVADPASLEAKEFDPVAVSDIVTASYLPGEWGPNNTLFKWSDEYSISARSKAYEHGVGTGTEIYPVVFKDLLVVEDWANVKVVHNSKALKKREFGFNPANPKYPGVSVLYVKAEPKGIYGNPCYTSAHIIKGGSNNVEHLAPMAAAADVYFGYKAITGSVKVQTILYPAKLRFENGKNICNLTLQKATGDWKIEYSSLEL